MKSLTLSKILLDFVDGCLEIMVKIAFSIGGDLPFHQGQDFLVTEVLDDLSHPLALSMSSQTSLMVSL